ncbi:hypothetical protein BDV98DRAFT_559060 [Pterulicium gracile]|uniref:Uncharacterized protein n=1 Tax=Pterulicium gracile TaxID=1884261 RepID=A0A5C3QW41_9AGAR|nr:hypothetical protein BDV98DRAFT_559060 [Pterula gracilis]
MSAQFLIKKNPSKKSTVRRALATSIKAAICLIIVRGAGVEKSASGGVKMVLNEEREYLRNPPVVPGGEFMYSSASIYHSRTLQAGRTRSPYRRQFILPLPLSS